MPGEKKLSAISRQFKYLGSLVAGLILLLIGAFPAWPNSRGWGYYPTGGLGLVLIIVIVLLLMGRI